MSTTAHAQSAVFSPKLSDDRSPFVRFFTDAEWYVSWGYSKQFWAPTDIHVSQPSLGNDFTLHGVQGHDEFKFSADPFGPQYNWRIGRFINSDRTIAVELNFDHTKYTSYIGQIVPVTGVIGGVPVSGNRTLDATTFSYMLHNGANHVMANLVYRVPVWGEINTPLSVAAIGKIGAGLMVPHTSDTILGNTVDVGQKTLSNAIGMHSGWWQINGWTVGAEGGFRVSLLNPVYLELTDKVAYARLNDTPAFQGTLSHNLWMNEIIFSIGYTYDGPK